MALRLSTARNSADDVIDEIESLLDDLRDGLSEDDDTEQACIKLNKLNTRISVDLNQLETQHTLGNIDDKQYELIKYHLESYLKILTI